ncbi:hypothetical protein HPB50_017690 [Hyalomma asiaticum]|uniref:Uncharacterized protein n=1 Tax=Hyalomma asiaticum TaxID=266040 RepID=A0ACB7SIW2_HYAAI|nr:hypothetical protein HPB50_017690 [Hyalomma asiaticum]
MNRRHFYRLVAGNLLMFLLVGYFFDIRAIHRKGYNITLPTFTGAVNQFKKWSQETFPNGKENLLKRYLSRKVAVDSSASQDKTKELCPTIPPNLARDLPVERNAPPLDSMHKEFPEVMEGGRFAPKECTARHRVAIVVPYRNRSEHVKLFIYNMHRFLSRQQIDYGIFIIEQALYDYGCFVFHDVDLIPIDQRNLYTCESQPMHMCVTIDDHLGVYYRVIFGGVCAMTKEQFSLVNGFSNEYWGWGGEDDEMYKSLDLLTNWYKRHVTDGLNSLVYEKLEITFHKLYTWIKVDLKREK